MKKTELYPLKFKPILKEKIWGGQNLAYKSNNTSKETKIGESWEISGVPNSVSVVKEGILEGDNLNDILVHYKDKLVGKSIYERFGNEFPLLIKFIDAKETLSVQIHPDDKIARKKHNCMGKTEMWYILKSEKDGFIIADFNKSMDEKSYLDSVENQKVQDNLKHINVNTGDVFFIAPGLIHAIGSGVVLAEIQQTSDITYRIYDWDRVDDKGNSRELHQQEALDAIDFTPKQPKIDYSLQPNEINKVVHNIHFKTDFLKINNKFEMDLTSWDSFTILINVGNDAKLNCMDKTFIFKSQETFLIPASVSSINIEAENTEILTVHI